MAGLPNSSTFDDFQVKGFARSPDFQETIVQTMTSAVEKGGKIHFNLTGLRHVEEIVKGKHTPESFSSEMTAFELWTVVINKAFYENTRFWLDGVDITDNAAKLKELGISFQKVETN